MYSENCLHREAVWDKRTPPQDVSGAKYNLLADPGRIPVSLSHERWHADLAYAKGWESEPDEGRRARTRFDRYFTRETNIRSMRKPRKRPSSCGRINPLAGSMGRWHDFVPRTLQDSSLWRNLDVNRSTTQS
jgi:hypothetical protein